MFWYKKAVDLGDVHAMFNYGLGLENGYLGSINQEEAMFRYKKAADLGNSSAIRRYQLCLENMKCSNSLLQNSSFLEVRKIIKDPILFQTDLREIRKKKQFQYQMLKFRIAFH
jgi:TPR repeat protein